MMRGDIKIAIICIKKSAEIKPGHLDAHHNLGIALQDKGDLNEAIASYNAALQIKHNNPEAHYNLGIALKSQGYITEAINSYHKALRLKPDYTDAQKNLSMAELLIGNYSSGLARYEYRLKCKKVKHILSANPHARHWNKQEITQCRQLLVVSEQGLGDTLQFIRYIKIHKTKVYPYCFERPKSYTL